MKAKNFWTLKLLPIEGEEHWHIVDGSGDIVIQAP